MAFIMCDGMDSYAAGADVLDKGWAKSAAPASEISIGSGNSRYGTDTLQIGTLTQSSATNWEVKRNFPRVVDCSTGGSVFVTFQFYQEVAHTSSMQPFFALFTPETATGDYGMALGIGASGELRLYARSGATITTTATGVMAENEWRYMCVELIARNSPNGECRVWVDGVQEINVTGSDFVDSNNPQEVHAVGLSGFSAASPHRFDDLIVYDDTGSNFNTALTAETRIFTFRPGAAGSSTTSTPSGAASAWDAVNGTGNDPGTVHTQFNSTGQDLYDMSGTLPFRPATITSVVVNSMTSDASFSQTGRHLLRNGATTNVGVTNTEPPNPDHDVDGYRWTQTAFNTDPATATAWEDDVAVNSIEFGYERVS
jgi:hypothetical protein